MSHGGATAGYRAYLARYPDQHVSVAILCNAGPANADALAHQVADVFLGTALGPEPRIAAIQIDAGEAGHVIGTFRGAKRGDMITVVRDKEGLRVERGAPLIATAPGRFAYGRSTADVFPVSGMPVTRIRVVASNATEDTYERVARATPRAEQLTSLSGVYRAPDVDADLQVVVEDGMLRIKSRPDRVIPLRPLYADAFESSVGLVRFVRGGNGEVTHLSVGTSRAWDVRFARVTGAPGTTPSR